MFTFWLHGKIDLKNYPAIGLSGDSKEQWGLFSDGRNEWTELEAVSSHFSSFNLWCIKLVMKFLFRKGRKKKTHKKEQRDKHTIQDEKIRKQRMNT